MFKTLSRSSSQNSLNEGERSSSPGTTNRNTERPTSSVREQEYLELDPQTATSIQFTKEHPIGAILIKLASDNTALARKTNLRGVETNINDLCTSFHTAIMLDKDNLKSELARSHTGIENSIIFKDLNSHKLNSAVHPPPYFSDVPVITSASKLAEVQKLLPHNLKFSGSRHDSMSVVEFLGILTTAQAQLLLTEAEFIDRMLACSTGLAHELISEWKTNGENVDTIYHNLLINFDKRIAPEDAKLQLSSFRIPKTATLAKAEAQIMILAGRTASALPEGPSRTAYYNLEACNTIIRALPPTSSATINNLYSTLSARLGRAATFAELSRGMNLYRVTIDKDIKLHGGENSFNNRKPPQKSRMGQIRPKYTTFSITTNNSRNFPSRKFGANEAQKRVRADVAMTNRSTNRNSTSFTPRPLLLKQIFNRNNAHQTPHPNTKVTQQTRNTNKRDHNGRFLSSNNGCSLCGMSNHIAKDCRNMQNDSGRKIDILPTYGTCGRCPSQIRPRLHHPESLCPFRPGGPLQGRFASA